KTLSSESGVPHSESDVPFISGRRRFSSLAGFHLKGFKILFDNWAHYTMADSYRVVVSDRADRMLVEQVKFLGRINKEAARKLIGDFEEALCSLEEFPLRFPFLDSSWLPEKKYRKLILSGRYLIIFQVKESLVYIEHVLDGRGEFSFLL
ncbi:MAG: type II toxin-antitoxin system RelE/ParE family toxin, partial [Spirochaetales bacterium]|nr:type II toxin-antitoxin system RelE/ParE family toxin [Spirochaetales bacterium]